MALKLRELKLKRGLYEKYRKYPIPLVDVDRSGRVKLLTLESILKEEKWISVKELWEDPLFRSNLYQSDWRCLAMRLLRYTRQGLLQRKKFRGNYRYKLTLKGKLRLFHLWDKFDMLSPPPDWEYRGEKGKMEYESVKKRLELMKDVTKAMRREILRLENLELGNI